MTQPSKYKVIKELVYKYVFLKERHLIREQQSTIEFIADRVGGKSYIFKVLGKLKEAGFIQVENGVVVKINQELPDDI